MFSSKCVSKTKMVKVATYKTNAKLNKADLWVLFYTSQRI